MGAATPAATGVVEAHNVGEAFASTTSLGESFMRAVAKKQPIPDLNLDADRGYGYRCWKCTWATLPWDSISPVDDSFV